MVQRELRRWGLHSDQSRQSDRMVYCEYECEYPEVRVWRELSRVGFQSRAGGLECHRGRRLVGVLYALHFGSAKFWYAARGDLPGMAWGHERDRILRVEQ